MVALLLLGATFAVPLVLAPYLLPHNLKVAEVSAQLGHGAYVIAAVPLLAGLLPLIARRWGTPRHAIAALFGAAALLVGAFDLNLSRLDAGRSVKQLVLALKPHLRPEDEIMTYRTYYQDLPVYLERRITVVDWKGELEFGTTVEDTSAWMIDEPTFRTRWLGPRTVYLLTTRSNYEALRAALPRPVRLIARSGQAVLLVNRDTTR